MLTTPRDGRYLAAADGEAVCIEADAGSRRVELDGPLAGLVALEEEIWAFVRRADGVELRRIAVADGRVGEPVKISCDAGPVLAAADGSAVAVVGERQQWWVVDDCGELRVHRVSGPPVVAIIHRQATVRRVMSGYVLSRAGSDVPLALPVELARDGFVGAAAMVGERSVAVWLMGRRQAGVILVDVARGEAIRCVRLAQDAVVALAGAHGRVVVGDGAVLRAIDIRGRAVPASKILPNAVEELVISPNGERVFFADREGELCAVDYAQLERSHEEPAHKDSSPDDDDHEDDEDDEIFEPHRDDEGLEDDCHADQARAITALAAAAADEDDDDAAAQAIIALAERAARREPDVVIASAPPPEGIERRRELAAQPLTRLSPRAASPASAAAARSNEAALFLVAAWCRRAIAEAWDSGRLSQPGAGALPFEAEVRAILDRAAGLAPGELAPSKQRAADVEAAWRAQPVDKLADSELHRIGAELGLSSLALDILLIVAAPRLQGELARSYGIIANDPSRPLCDELLVAQILGADGPGRAAIAAQLAPGAPLVASGAIAVGAGEVPFAPLSAMDALVRRLQAGPAPCPPSLALDELFVPLDALEQLVGALSTADAASPRIVVRGRRGVGRRTLLVSLAARAGRPLEIIEIDARDPDAAGKLRRSLCESRVRGALPCLDGIDLVVSSQPTLAAALFDVIEKHPGAVALRAGLDGRLPFGAGLIEVMLPIAGEPERERAWRASLERRFTDGAASCIARAAQVLAAKYAFGVGSIERVAAGADGDAREPEDLVRRVDMLVRQQRAATLESVATRVTRLSSWSSLVLPHELLDSLREFIGRVKLRRTVFDEWGFDAAASSARGLTALFQGGPGTGKSLVAGAIARELGYELYRVDLGRLLSKWIGETEKNLASVFDAAEEGEVVLLFDEADSLFTRRTEVRTSVDRYANAEVNYLLQRLDSFEGIAVLTTNFGTAIDPAFRRRMTLRLTFPFPDEDARAELWRVHLPPSVPRGGGLDLGGLARRYEISGGYIRNAALRAAFLAAHEGQPLCQEHLERAVRLEYRENGKLTDEGRLE
jgi:hypothetical protein